MNVTVISGVFSVIWILFIVITMGFWVWALVDCLKREFIKSNDKIIWVIVILFLNFLGAVLYYFLVHKKEEEIRKDTIL